MVSLSIITATYNSEATIQRCLDSVMATTLCTEHIIIDGGSTDQTLEIAKSFRHVKKIISEPDEGMYDAMNKGIDLSTGDVIGILNSDDFYSNPEVLSKISEVFENSEVESCYGDLQYVDAKDISKITRVWKSGCLKPNSFAWGWMPPHPTFFVRRNVYIKYGKFNTKLGSAADYELMLRLLEKFKITTTYIPEVLVTMRSGGVSNSSIINRIKANRMDKLSWEINGLKPLPWTIIFKPLRKIIQYATF